MYQNCCKKCGSISLHTEIKGNNTGLYCNNCGKWQQWLSKDELRAFEYSQKQSCYKTNNDLKEKLENFITGIDKEIDVEYEKLPTTNEEAIRKNTYCFALEKCKTAILNILSGREFYDFGE